MANYIATDVELTSVANAIRTKGGTSDPLSFPDGFVSAVEAIPTGGGGSVPAKEVNFRDYDGTVVYSYTPAEFAALTAMPDNPDHSGDAIPLTSQGWNWSFANAQAYVAKYGRLEVGQMYATADGKTHVLIHLEQGRTSPILGCCPNGSVDVDWGDGTAHDTLTGTSASMVKWTPKHNYAAPGDYDIKLTCTGTMGFYGSNSGNQYSGLLRYSTGGDGRNRVYQNSVHMVYCADSVTRIGSNVFQYCYGLTNITITDSVTSIGSNAFQYCNSLTNVIIPDRVTNIGSYAFSACSKMTNVTIPDSVTSIGNNAFNACTCLINVTIPDSVTSVSTGVFSSCSSLSNVTISMTSIGSNAFQFCDSLSSMVILDSVTSISAYAFQNCSGLGEIHFNSTTPPTVSATSTFTGVPTDCKIYVPTGSLAAYTSATNYPSSSTYTYIEE